MRAIRSGPEPEDLEDLEFHVAPMVGVTTRHFRQLMRLISKRATLWTEMVVPNEEFLSSLERRRKILDFDESQHPVVLQLAGTDPELLGKSVALVEPWGYDEINLNCGCPSRNAQVKSYGAALMLDPPQTAAIVGAMLAAARGSGTAISVKCRVGAQDSVESAESQETTEEEDYDALRSFVTPLAEAGVRRFYVHARAALFGFSTEGNRSAPPLRHALVRRLAAEFPGLEVVANGGAGSIAAAAELAGRPLRGAMVGRAVRDKPYLWAALDRDWFAEPGARPRSRGCVLEAYADYAEGQLARIDRLTKRRRQHLVEPLIPLFAGEPGLARWQRLLSWWIEGDSPVEGLALRAVVAQAAADLGADTLDAHGLEEEDEDAPRPTSHSWAFHVHPGVRLEGGRADAFTAMAKRAIRKDEFLLGIKPVGMPAAAAHGLIAAGGQRPNCRVELVSTERQAKKVGAQLPPGAPGVCQQSRLVFARSSLAAGESLVVACKPRDPALVRLLEEMFAAA